MENFPLRDVVVVNPMIGLIPHIGSRRKKEYCRAWVTLHNKKTGGTSIRHAASVWSGGDGFNLHVNSRFNCEDEVYTPHPRLFHPDSTLLGTELGTMSLLEYARNRSRRSILRVYAEFELGVPWPCDNFDTRTWRTSQFCQRECRCVLQTNLRAPREYILSQLGMKGADGLANIALSPSPIDVSDNSVGESGAEFMAFKCNQDGMNPDAPAAHSAQCQDPVLKWRRVAELWFGDNESTGANSSLVQGRLVSALRDMQTRLLVLGCKSAFDSQQVPIDIYRLAHSRPLLSAARCPVDQSAHHMANDLLVRLATACLGIENASGLTRGHAAFDIIGRTDRLTTLYSVMMFALGEDNVMATRVLRHAAQVAAHPEAIDQSVSPAKLSSGEHAHDKLVQRFVTQLADAVHAVSCRDKVLFQSAFGGRESPLERRFRDAS